MPANNMDIDAIVKSRIKKVNSLINSRNSNNIKYGVVLIANSLAEFTTNTAIENFTVWVDVLPNILFRSQHPSTNYLASFCFGKLLKIIRSVSSASREISSQKIPLVLSNLLQNHSIEDPIPVLDCILPILEHYHSSCTSLKSKTIKYLSPFLSSAVQTIQIKAAQCWRLIPYVGPSGVQNSEHVKNWEVQMNEVLSMLEVTTNEFLNKEVSSGTGNMGFSTIIFQPVPEKEPELSVYLTKKYCSLTICIKHLLSAKFDAPVKILFNKIIDILLQCMNLSPSAMGHTSEMLLRSKQLPNIQSHALSLLKVIVSVCGEHISVYSTIITRIIINLLDQTEQQQLRVDIYDFICIWVEQSASMFLCGSDTQNQAIYQHFKDDICPVNPNQTLAIQVLSSAKKRKRSTVTSQEIFQNNRNMFVTPPSVNALIALNMCISKSGNSMSPNLHKRWQSMIVNLLLKTHQKMNPTIYTKSSNARLLLYKLLLNLTSSSSCYVVPPFGYARSLFAKGLNDSNLEIRAFCQQSLSLCENALYANPSSVHSCNIDLSQPVKEVCKADEKYDEIIKNGCLSQVIENHLEETEKQKEVIETEVSDVEKSDSNSDGIEEMNGVEDEKEDIDSEEEFFDNKMQIGNEEVLNGWTLREESPNVLLSTSSCHGGTDEKLIEKTEEKSTAMILPESETNLELEDCSNDISNMLNDFIDSRADAL